MFARLLTIEDDRRTGRRLFWVLSLVTMAFRCGLAAWLPITGDEAYFVDWGRHPDWGFYDHPPMVGWWLALLVRCSTQPWVLRLPALLVPWLLAWITGRSLERFGATRAWGAAGLLLLVPLDAWNVAITTDIPLMFFSGTAVLAYLRALRSQARLDWCLAGLCMGGALASKYFALMLAGAMLLHLVLCLRGRAAVRAIVCMSLTAAPAIGVQLIWNWTHCWPNVMFNVINRHGDAHLSGVTPLLYLMSVAYVLTPSIFCAATAALVRRRHTSDAVGATERQALAWFTVVPFAAFAVLSSVKTIGLHWLAAFVLPSVVWFVLRVPLIRIERSLRWAAAIALAHYVVIVGLAMQPIERWQGTRIYDGLVMTLRPQEFNDLLTPWKDGWIIASDGYSAASTLGFNLGRAVPVFGPGSSHARHDDILTDWRQAAGRNVLVVRKDPPHDEEYTPYFEAVSVREETLRGARYYLIEGRGFRFDVYRQQVLEPIRQRWYALPRWLPQGPCYFCDRYFPDRACHL